MATEDLNTGLTCSGYKQLWIFYSGVEFFQVLELAHILAPWELEVGRLSIELTPVVNGIHGYRAMIDHFAISATKFHSPFFLKLLQE